MSCQVKQCSDRMYCEPCKRAWDVNDPNPPDCCKQELTIKACLQEAINFIEISKGKPWVSLSPDWLQRSKESLKPRTREILDDQPFYELMQSYRHCDSMNQFAVSNAYEKVKAFIREHYEVKIGGMRK